MTNSEDLSGDPNATLTVTDFEKINMEYEQVNENLRALADNRFKLLALVPPLGGVAIFALSKMAGVEAGSGTLVPPPGGVGIFLFSAMNAPEPVSGTELALVWLVSMLGFLATVGITFYDQRNSELYNALGGRANYLEHSAKLTTDADQYPPSLGGQFLERPKPGRLLFGVRGLLMKHDRGLALIYGPVLGAWFFPIVFSALGALNAVGLLRSMAPYQSRLALGAAAFMVVVFIYQLLKLDDTFSESRSATVSSFRKVKGKRILRLKFKIRGEGKTLTGVLVRRLSIRRKDYEENCEGRAGKADEIPAGANVRVRYKNSLLRKPAKRKKIFKIECLEKAKKPATK